MKIVIKTENLKLNKDLEDFIEEKINSLEKFLKILYSEPSRIISTRFSKRKPNIAKRAEISLLGEDYYNHFFTKGKPKVEAWLEIGKKTLHHKKGIVFFVECQMRLPGKSLRSSVSSKNLKLAINEVKDELQRELKEYKEKIIAQTKRKVIAFKKELKLSPGARFYRKGKIREEGI